MKVFFKYILFLFILFIKISFFSCTSLIDNEQEARPIPQNIENHLKHLDEQIDFYYCRDPDSSEYYSYKAINFLDSVGFPELKKRYYHQLCELYQYRKPDYQKAMLNLSNAIRMLIKHSDYYRIKGFLLINIGNQFYNFGFYEEAIALYRVAAENDFQDNFKHARITAYHNISLSFTKMQKTDSAVYYLEQAREKMPTPNDLKYALNDVYHAEIWFMKNEHDSVLKHLKRSFYILNKNNFYKNSLKNDTKGMDYIFLHETASNSYRLLSRYYFERGQDKKAAYYFYKAMENARTANSAKLIANLYFEKVLRCCKTHDDSCLNHYLDSAEKYIFLINDLSLQKAFADSMIKCLQTKNLSHLQKKYMEVSTLLEDSIVSQKSSFELQQNLMLLSSVIAEHTAYKQQLEKESKIKVIKYQNRLILIILFFLLMMIIAFFTIYLQKRHLNRMYRAMVGQVKKNLHLKKVKGNDNVPQSSIYEKFEEELEIFMDEQKPYLNKSLTVNELASMLNTNYTYLSNYINQKFGMNFNDFINKYRVNEACKLLNENTNITIEGLAEQSGFNSKSTFYAAFKKMIGMSPSVFIKNNKDV